MLMEAQEWCHRDWYNNDVLDAGQDATIDNTDE